ncbi:hypothetical protein HC864_04590 [Candidatus Gracilibacteria bacterium]|nr:hypothetical protein [Candidatus Gracilibacteria bacterium]
MLPKSINYTIWKTAILPLVDFLAIVFGAGLVYLIRYRWYSEAFFDNTNVLRSSNYITFSLLLAACILVVYVILGLYELNSKIIGIFGVFLRG